MKNKALLWINAILFYDLRNIGLWDPNKKKKDILDWMNSRAPLSERIREYNERHR